MCVCSVWRELWSFLSTSSTSGTSWACHSWQPGRWAHFSLNTSDTRTNTHLHAHTRTHHDTLRHTRSWHPSSATLSIYFTLQCSSHSLIALSLMLLTDLCEFLIAHVQLLWITTLNVHWWHFAALLNTCINTFLTWEHNMPSAATGRKEIDSEMLWICLL